MTDEDLEVRVSALLTEAAEQRVRGSVEVAEKSERTAAALALYGDPNATPPGGHGDRIFGVLRGLARNDADADDAFGDFAVDVVKGIRTFEGNSSLRTWLYVVARNALRRYKRRDPRQREAPLAEDGDSKVRDFARKSTTSWRKAEKDHALVALRRELDEKAQEILILRVDRGFSWMDVARVLLGVSGAEDFSVLTREAARVKKRFERIKEELRKKATEGGLR